MFSPEKLIGAQQTTTTQGIRGPLAWESGTHPVDNISGPSHPHRGDAETSTKIGLKQEWAKKEGKNSAPAAIGRGAAGTKHMGPGGPPGLPATLAL